MVACDTQVWCASHVASLISLELKFILKLKDKQLERKELGVAGGVAGERCLANARQTGLGLANAENGRWRT